MRKSMEMIPRELNSLLPCLINVTKAPEHMSDNCE